MENCTKHYSKQRLQASGILIPSTVPPSHSCVLIIVDLLFSGACCSAQCGRSGCSLCASSIRGAQRSRKSRRWCTPSSASCSTMPSNMSGVAGASGWIPCPSRTPRSEHSLNPYMLTQLRRSLVCLSP